MEKSKVSIISGIYNCADTLPMAIESILKQTYKNWEWILCDDCSTDDTYNIAKEYVDKYPGKFILIKNKKNSKLAYSLNHCLQYATGYYIARMDADDISTPDRIEKEVQWLKDHPDMQMVGTAIQWFDDEHGLNKIIYLPEKPDKWTLHKSMPFIHATFMTYKSVLAHIGNYTVAERTNRAQDYDLYFKFYAAGYNGGNIQEPLYQVREDNAAFKRRTFMVRWNAFKTTKIGYKMLGYPKAWLVEAFLVTIIKGVTPVWLYKLYRRRQINQ